MEIKVMISGLILLVSSNAYMSSGGTDAIRAALVVNGTMPFESKYDVDIPIHRAMLTVNDPDVTVIDPDSRFTPPDGDVRTLILNGDRMQFGTGAEQCRALAFSPGTVPFLTDSTRTIPRLGEIVDPNIMLASGAFPGGPRYDRFSDVDKDLTSGWLEMIGGRLRVARADGNSDGVPDDDEVEFRPSRKRHNLAGAVEWSTGTVDCMVITSYLADNPPSPVTIVFNKSTQVSLSNMAQADTGELIPGVGYDYELLYRVVRNPPTVPPIPYAIGRAAQDDRHVHGSTGVNCGPPRIR